MALVADALERQEHALALLRRHAGAAIDHAHVEGGVVQFNHAAWYPFKVLKFLPREWWLAQGIDGWEVYNGFGFVDEEALGFIKKHRGERVMFAGAGTDVHDPAKHYRMYTEVLTQDRSVNGVIDALKAGKTRVINTAKTAQAQDRLERGKLVLDPERLAYIKRWAWLDWIGIAIMQGKNQLPVKLFLLAIMLLGVALSVVL